MPTSRRKFLKKAGLGLAAGILACPVATPAAADAREKKLIAWGGIDWYSPATVQMNIARIEQLPFDGTVLQGFKARLNGEETMFDWLCFGRQSFQREHLADTISLLGNIRFQRFTHNLLRFNVTPGDVDWFDDFTPILHNARLWAEVARDTGMKGWLFDVEDYKGRVFNYANMQYRDQKTFTEYAEQARLRGREFMQAAQEGFPQIVLLLALAHSYVNRAPRAAERLEQLEYGLLPAFLNGLIEAAGPQTRIIDGHEQSYGYLTAEDYYRGYLETHQRSLDLVPPALHSRYDAHMEAAMALYVNYALQLEGAAKGPPSHLSADDRLQLLEHNVYHALSASDEYVWCYGERISWWEDGYPVELPAGALDAIRRGRAKFEAQQPLGFDMYARIAAARAADRAD
jgi:hypothetical protein